MLASEEHTLTSEEKRQLNRERLAEENLPLKSLLCTHKFAWIYALVVCHMFYGYYMSNEFK